MWLNAEFYKKSMVWELSVFGNTIRAANLQQNVMRYQWYQGLAELNTTGVCNCSLVDISRCMQTKYRYKYLCTYRLRWNGQMDNHLITIKVPN